MLTALILQLVQCMLMAPKQASSRNEDGSPGEQKAQPEVDVAMIQSYELALRTGKNFLSTFMKK